MVKEVKGKNIVWEFTNQRKLNKKAFLDYFERKVFRTIRKYEMMKGSLREIKIKKGSDLNAYVLKYVLEKKFSVSFSTKGLSFDNLSLVSEEIFGNILGGKFEGKKPSDDGGMPLYFLSDAEIELYASLVGLKGGKRKSDKHVQELFEKFMKKNPDLEHNIVNAFSQL
jgi:hypothetical protein